MALNFADRVRETASAPGTGAVTLLGAVTGYQTFAAIGNGNQTYYTIATQGGTQWEVGLGTYTASGTTLTRNTVLSNSLGTTAFINFSSGTQDVFCTYPSETGLFSSNNPGTAGYVLTSNGAGVSPSWEQAGGSNIFSGFYLSADRSVLYVDYSDGTPSSIDTANYLTWTAAINTSYSITNNNLNMLI
jgi:hypothetical protein